MPQPYSKQEMTQQTLLYLHQPGEVCAIIGNIILKSVQKFIDHTTCTGTTLYHLHFMVSVNKTKCTHVRYKVLTVVFLRI